MDNSQPINPGNTQSAQPQPSAQSQATQPQSNTQAPKSPSKHSLKNSTLYIIIAALVVIIAVVLIFIFTRPQTSDTSDTTFEDEITSINAELDSILFAENNEINQEDFINNLLQKIDDTSDVNQKSQLIITAANYYYYSSQEYEKGINLLLSLDRTNLTIDNNLSILESLVTFYTTTNQIDLEKETINQILALPDEALSFQEMSVVKEYYNNLLKELPSNE